MPPSGHGQGAPALVTLEDRGVRLTEELRGDRLADRAADLVGTRPDVREVDRLPILGVPERLGRQVDVDAAGERERHDERRRGEVGRAHLRMDATLEVAVAREDGRDDEAVLVDGLGDRHVEWARVADAGRAAVADDVEAERLEIGEETGSRRGTE